MAGENCTSNCPTSDHATFGECMRAKNIRPMWLGGTGPSFGDQKRFDQETNDYRDIVRAGGSLSTAINKGRDAAIKQIEG